MSQPTTKDTSSSQYSIPASDHIPEASGSASLKDKASRTMDTARRKTEETVQHAKKAASDTYDRAREEASHAYSASKDTITHSFRQQPLAYALGAFAAGVLVGMLVPTSRPERETLSGVANRAARKVREKGEEAATIGREAMSDAAEAANQRIRNPDHE